MVGRIQWDIVSYLPFQPVVPRVALIGYYFVSTASMRIPAQALSAAFCAPAIDYTCVSPYDGRNINSSDANADQCYNGDTEKYCTDWDYDTSTFSYTLTNQVMFADILLINLC